MGTHKKMPFRPAIALAFVLALTACSKGVDSQKAAQAAAPLLVSAEEDVLMLFPALTISRETAERGLDIFERSL